MMSTPGLISPFSFLPGMPQPYQRNTIVSSPNMVQFPPNAQPITFTGLSSLPFMNTCDLASQLISPISYGFINDIDVMNGDKFLGENNLSIRILMSGKEVGSIIGKRGDNIKRFREESMAHINISDGNSPERIVTISGSCEQICHAVELLCKKLEDDAVNASESNSSVLSIRMLIQPVQYIAIMTDRGGQMLRLREISEATMLFGMDFLPNSSERLLTVSGSSKSIISYMVEICKILIEIPCNAFVVPYSPNSLSYSDISQTIAVNGHNKMVNPTFGDGMPMPAPTLPVLSLPNIYPQSFYSDQISYPIGLPMSLIPLKIPNNLPTYLHKLPRDPSWSSSSNSVQLQEQTVSREFFVENEMIGCIIGRGGSTINEIRAMSGAQIKISNCEDGKQERRINISGTFDSVQTAQLLINSSLELYKQSVKIKSASNTSSPIMLTNPLLNTNYQLASSISQNLLQQPLFIFNSNLKSDMNISLLNCIQKEESETTQGFFSHDSLGRHTAKMSSTQVHLDGSKNISTQKFKPY